MKKFFAALLTIAVVFSCFFAMTVSAEDIIEGNTYTAVCGEGSNWAWDAEAKTLTYTNVADDSWTFTFTLKNNNLTWTAYADNNEATLDDIIIPSYVKVDDATTYAVTTINKGAANGKATIKSIVIYEGVTSVGGSVFENCAALESIKFPSTVTAIGDYCFKQCYALTNVDFKDTQIKSLGRDMFYKCTALTAVELPSGIETLGQGVFSACSALADVELPASLKSIGNTTFASTALTSVTIPANVTTIGTYAYQKCAALTEAYVLSEGLTAIPEGLFSECTSLTTVEFPDTVTTIGKYAFQKAAFTSFDFTGITTLANYAFQYAKLTSVVLPEETVNIGEGAFYRCYDIQTVEIRSEGLTAIPKNCFNECKVLASVSWPDTVTELGVNAFYKSGAFPLDLTGITTVGDGCFQWSVHNYYVIPESVTSIGKLAFQNNNVKYMIFEGKTAPAFGGTAGDARNNGQGLRSDAKISGKVYVPVNGAGYEDAYANFFTTSKMTLHYIGANITSITANATGYTIGYEYNVAANIQDSTNTAHQSDRIMIALYNGDGALVAAKTASATETTVDIEATEAIASAKIFALDSITTIRPLYEAHEAFYTAAE